MFPVTSRLLSARLPGSAGCYEKPPRAGVGRERENDENLFRDNRLKQPGSVSICSCSVSFFICSHMILELVKARRRRKEGWRCQWEDVRNQLSVPPSTAVKHHLGDPPTCRPLVSPCCCSYHKNTSHFIILYWWEWKHVWTLSTYVIEQSSSGCKTFPQARGVEADCRDLLLYCSEWDSRFAIKYSLPLQMVKN